MPPTRPRSNATEPPAPADISSNDELYITGLHLDQYRHATRSPALYWREALRRDIDHILQSPDIEAVQPFESGNRVGGDRMSGIEPPYSAASDSDFNHGMLDDI